MLSPDFDLLQYFPEYNNLHSPENSKKNLKGVAYTVVYL